jgi:hypothetical protein
VLVSQLAYAFSQEQLRFLGSEMYRASVEDDEFVDGIVFEIGQADKGSPLTPIQFGPRLPALIESLIHFAQGARGEADLAEDLAAKLKRHP